MHLETLINRYPALEVCREQIAGAYALLEACFSEGRSLYVCGNGGSCADAEHIVAELMKAFKRARKCPASFAEKLLEIDPERGARLALNLERGLPAMALNAHPALCTAYQNDVEGGGELIYAQQLYVHGQKGDVLMGISTSGNARNVMYAAVTARALGMKVIGLTGKDGGALGRFADVSIKVPETECYKIQELHLPVYHCLCLMLEETFYH